MIKKIFAALLLSLLFFAACPAAGARSVSRPVSLPAAARSAPPPFDFYERGPYRRQVPKPGEILKYDVGEHHTTYAQMETVVRAIAGAAPERVRVFEIGKTNEHRTMYLIAVSAPQNIARLDEIKDRLAKLSDPRRLAVDEAEKLIESTPLAVWLSYAIHGNESSSFETMMQVLYQLAASEEAASLNILQNSVALIVACANPDGHERFATWYNSVAAGDADRDALEHHEPWSVNGRYNRYRFDLNRDNIAATQRETQNLQKAFFEWHPQVSADHHGQTSQYFFPPHAEPFNPNLPPVSTRKWLSIFGRANAAEFDRRNWDYYTGDIFDLFYPGYWDSFPALSGTTAMTYETDGGGYKGLRWRRDDGTIATFRESIAKHFVASMATLETAAANRREKMADFVRFKQTAIAEGAAEKMKRVVILPGRDPFKAAELVEILRRAKIEVKVAPRGFASKRAHGYESSAAGKAESFPPGSYFVDLAQPQKRLAKALLEPRTPADEKFIREELATFRRNEMRGKSAARDYYRFYDITAWSLPLAFGLDAFWTEDAADAGDSRLVTDDYLAQAKTGRVEGGRANHAYLIPYETDNAPVLAYRLLKEGFRVHVAARALNADGGNRPAGTFVVRLTRNPDTVHEAIGRLSRELGVNAVAVRSGYIEAGDTGVGSENILPLELPKIAVAVGEAVEHPSYGAIWWTLDRAGIEFTALELDKINSRRLRDFNTLILPDGDSGKYAAALGGIKSWIEAGGTVVCLKGAAIAATTTEAALTTAKTVGGGEDESKPAPVATPDAKASEMSKQPEILLPPLISPTANAGKIPEAVPGAIMRASLDRTTPLTYGLQDRQTLPVLISTGNFLRLSKEGVNAVVFSAGQADELTISGFVWENNTARLLNRTAYLIDEPVGRGHVILFADDPLFRGLFRGSKRLFYNSILIAPVF